MATIENAGSRLLETAFRNAFFRLAVMAACLLVWLVGFRSLIMPALRGLGEPGSVPGDSARLVGSLAYAVGAIFLYRTLVRRIERRPADELAGSRAVKNGLAGASIGAALACTAIGLIGMAAKAHFVGSGDASRLAGTLSAAIMAAAGEELLFRGVLYRILEQAFGTVAALSASALLFGLAHLVNPDSTLMGALAIAVEAGLLLGLAYVVTRTLWFPIGLHLAWNFTQGGIFGPASGESPHGLVRLAFAGPDWLTGGRAGVESSILTIGLCLALATVFAQLAVRRGEWRAAKLKLRLA